jgi:hypothetical protein
MTLTTTSREVIYQGNDVTTVFPYAFRIDDAAHVEVYTRVAEATDLTQVFNFSVTGIGVSTGGNITYPTAGPALATGLELVILRTVPYTQELDITNQDGFLPETLEDELDMLEMQIQQLAATVDRAPLFPHGTEGRTFDDIPEGHLWRADFYGNGVDGGVGTVNSVTIDAATESYPTLNGAGGAILSSPVTDVVEIHGYNTVADFAGTFARYKAVAVEPTTHDHYFEAANGRFFEGVPAAPITPVPVTVLGLLLNQGPTFDCTPAFNKVIEAADNSGCKHWCFPAGGYYFNTRPDDINILGVRFIGDGSDTAVAMVKNFRSLGTADGIFNFRESNFALRDMRFLAVEGSQAAGTFIGTGCMISIVSQTGKSIGYGEIDNIEITGDASLPNGHACDAVHIYLDGTDSSAGAGAGFGVRAIDMTRLKLFGAEVYTLWMHNTVSCWASGQGTFRAGGLSGAIAIDGSVGTKSQGNIIQFSHVSDGMIAAETTGLQVNVGQWDAGVISIASTAAGWASGDLRNTASLSNANLVDFQFFNTAMPVISGQGSNANGRYRKWSNGRIEQWGSGATIAGVGAITFPLAFGTACDSIQINCSTAPAANSINLMQAHTLITTGCGVVGMELSNVPAAALLAATFKWYATGF